MKKTKKLLALVLALMMAFTTLALPAMAAEIDQFADVSPVVLGDAPLDSDIVETQDFPISVAVRLFSNEIQDTSNSDSIKNVRSVSPLQRSTGQTVDGVLLDAGLSESYTLEVDHSLLPEILICAYPSGSINDFKITICRESDQKTWSAQTENTISGGTILAPKRFFRFANADGITETYTITLTALTADTYYAFTVGTPDTFADDFSGLDTFATVPKNTPEGDAEAMCTTYFLKGYQALLNEGEWFHYTADGETYITAGMTRWNDLAFDVYDIENEVFLYSTTPDDCVIRQLSDTLYEGYVQKRLDLEPGKDYLICFYSTTFKQVESIWDTYNIWIGHPYFHSEDATYKSAAYSIPANTTKTFVFNVSGFPESMRADPLTAINATGSGKYMDTRISSCRITAPNGYTFTARYGQKSGLPYPVLFNYLENPANIPINGKWTVTVTTSQAISDWRFVISGGWAIVGNDGN